MLIYPGKTVAKMGKESRTWAMIAQTRVKKQKIGNYGLGSLFLDKIKAKNSQGGHTYTAGLASK